VDSMATGVQCCDKRGPNSALQATAKIGPRLIAQVVSPTGRQPVGRTAGGEVYHLLVGASEHGANRPPKSQVAGDAPGR